MKQLTLFSFICSCGGEYEAYPKWNKKLASAYPHEWCLRCWHIRFLNEGEGI